MTAAMRRTCAATGGQLQQPRRHRQLRERPGGTEIDFSKFKDLVKTNQERVNRSCPDARDPGLTRPRELHERIPPVGQIAEAKAAVDRLRANMRLVIVARTTLSSSCSYASPRAGTADRGSPGSARRRSPTRWRVPRTASSPGSSLQATCASDVTGVAIYDEHREFVFKPVRCSLTSSSRTKSTAPAEDQSALLEVMDRAKVTVDGHAHAVGAPFMSLPPRTPSTTRARSRCRRARWTVFSCA